MAQFNQAQHVAMLDEIAVTAGRVAELARMIQANVGEPVDSDVLAATVETMAQRIGWLTAIATQAHKGEPLGGAVPDAWIMPPMVLAEGMAGFSQGDARQ